MVQDGGRAPFWGKVKVVKLWREGMVLRGRNGGQEVDGRIMIGMETDV